MSGRTLTTTASPLYVCFAQPRPSVPCPHGAWADRYLQIANPSVAALYEDALVYESGSAITASGALSAYSGAKTGRSPSDKRIVKEPSSENEVWWGPVNKAMTPSVRASPSSIPSQPVPISPARHGRIFLTCLVQIGPVAEICGRRQPHRRIRPAIGFRAAISTGFMLAAQGRQGSPCIPPRVPSSPTIPPILINFDLC